MYRWPFQAETAIGSTSEVGSPSALLGATTNGETGRLEVWKTWGRRAGSDFQSPFEQEGLGRSTQLESGNWFRNLWPRMPGFSLLAQCGCSMAMCVWNVRGREVEKAWSCCGVPPHSFMS